MNEKIADSVSLILKVSFFLLLGLLIWTYAPPEFWLWWKEQAEWAVGLFK